MLRQRRTAVCFYQIREGDEIELLNYYTVQQVTEVMDVLLDPAMQILINHEPADMDSKVYDNFTLEWKLAEEKRQKPKNRSRKQKQGQRWKQPRKRKQVQSL